MELEDKVKDLREKVQVKRDKDKLTLEYNKLIDELETGSLKGFVKKLGKKFNEFINKQL